MTTESRVVVLTVREALIARNMTQKQLAALTGLRPSAVSSLARNDVQRVQLDHLTKIADALGITDIRDLITLR